MTLISHHGQCLSQIVMSSKEKRHVRQSRVELEYSPSHTYSLDSTYSLDLPLVLDVSVATPLSGYESLSASFRHNMRQSAMDTSAQVSHWSQLMGYLRFPDACERE